LSLDKALACEFREDGKWQTRNNGKLEAYPTSVGASLSAASGGLGAKRANVSIPIGSGMNHGASSIPGELIKPPGWGGGHSVIDSDILGEIAVE
jgi:hypothetical protein